MPTPEIDQEAAELRFALVWEYLDRGYATKGQPSPKGSMNAVCMAAMSQGYSRNSAAAWLRAAERALRRKFPFPAATRRIVSDEIDIPESLPSVDRTVEELLEARKQEFGRQNEAYEARKLIPIGIKLDGPIAVSFFGDPHVDDPGTNIAQLERHLETVKATEGMYGGNVGDSSNNWVGRLAHLYSEQQVTQSEAWRLVEWLVTWPIWLFLIAGNHDVWSGARDPIQWMLRNRRATYHQHGARIALRFPNGNEVRINCRHDFAGHSMWNPAHGPMKAAQGGWNDHIMVCGHKHISGYGIIKDAGSGLIAHCLRVAGYKQIDQYAAKLGLPDQNISPTFTVLIDPRYNDNDPRLITTIFDVEEAADILKFKRRK